MNWNLLLFLILGAAAIITAFFLYGSFHWEAETEKMRAALTGTRFPVSPHIYDPAELIDLPPVVQRYFQTVLVEGQPLLTAVRIEHTGTFNVSQNSENWHPFTSDQLIITRRPGFDWDARIQMLPGIEVRVHDAYIGGEGIMYAALFGVISVAGLRGSADMARGQLMRYFAEAAWYPTALLPGQGVSWQLVDDRSARATLVEENNIITMLFRFDDNNLIESVRADARGRTVGDQIIPTPWVGRWHSYERRDGMYIPMAGEVAWVLEGGLKPYWRGRITSLTYEFPR